MMSRLCWVTDDLGRKQPKNPLGPTGERVIANIKQLRQSKGLNYKQLSERLESLGRPIPVLGLSRLERGERRVDVDDLVALAIALETTPNRLLLPGSDIEVTSEAQRLTPDITSTPPLMWAWATGEVPLGHPPVRATDHIRFRSKEIEFTRENLAQHWGLAHWPRSPAEPRPRSGFALIAVGINAFVAEAFRRLFSTEDIRAIVEGAITTAVLSPDPMHETSVEVTDDGGSLPPEHPPQARGGG